MAELWTGEDALLADLLSLLDEPAPTAALVAVTSDASPVVRLSGVDDATSDSQSDRSVASPPPPAPLLISSEPQKKTSRRRAGANYVCPIKRTLDGLREEAEKLSAEVNRLRAHALIGSVEVALTERYKRRRAEDERQRLREAVYAQTQFLRGLRSVFSAPMAGMTSVDLCLQLHNYTRLPRDRSTRWSEYASLGEERRMQNAMEILCRETEALTCEDAINTLATSVATPFIKTEVTTDSGGFAVTTTSVYAVETGDVGAVLRGACVAVRDIVVKCTSYQCTNLKRVIVDPEATATASNLLYRVMGVHHKSLHSSDELQVESRIVTLYKQTEDCVVVLWDYVDDDELHPTMSATDISRQGIGACLIRREICEDGVERSVYRAFSTRKYRYPRGSNERIKRFEDLTVATTHDNELIFRNILLDSIAKEEAAYARAVRTVSATE